VVGGILKEKWESGGVRKEVCYRLIFSLIGGGCICKTSLFCAPYIIFFIPREYSIIMLIIQ
jgi:hypothetical protein